MEMMLPFRRCTFRFFFLSSIPSHNGEAAPPTSSLSLRSLWPMMRRCPMKLRYCCCFPCHLHQRHGPRCCRQTSQSSSCWFPLRLQRRSWKVTSVRKNRRRPISSLAAVCLRVAAAELILSLAVRLPLGK